MVTAAYNACFRTKPTTPDAAISAGSGMRFIVVMTPSVTAQIRTVGTSTRARRPSTITAPAMAPVAAAVTPSTNALMRARALGKAAKMWCRKNGHEIDRREHADRRDGGPDWSRNEIADERHCDHDRARRDHRDGDRVEELPLREPMELLDDAAVQERHDREPAAEHEESCGGEVREYFPEHPHGCRPSQTRRKPRWPRRDEQRVAPQ